MRKSRDGWERIWRRMMGRGGRVKGEWGGEGRLDWDIYPGPSSF